MARKFQIKRGLKAKLPTLAQGEFAMTTDSGSECLWLGTGSQNKRIPLDPTAADVGAVENKGLLSDYSTVLAAATLETTAGYSFFAVAADDSALFNAPDAPFGAMETQYFVYLDTAPGDRRTVLAMQYGGGKVATRDIFRSNWLTDWAGLTVTSRGIQTYNRTEIGTAPNFDDPGVNGFFELRGSSEIPDATGTRPFADAYYGSILSLKTADKIAMMQIAANPTGNEFYGRNAHCGNVSMVNIPWWQFLMMKDGMLQTGLKVDSPNTKAAVTKNRTVSDGTQYQSTFGISEDAPSKPYAVIDIKDVTNSGSNWGIGVSAKEQKPIFYEYFGGVFYVNDIHHTGNKPSGSYTGNGSAATREILTGGIGSAVAIWSSAGNAIVLYYGGLTFASSSGTTALSSHVVNFRDGKLLMATDDPKLNANGQTYYYQVL